MPRAMPMIGVALMIVTSGRQPQEIGEWSPAKDVTQGHIAGKVKTGKERLSDKASDDQRVDNCKVALDRRGPNVRPDGCKLNH